MVQSLFSTSTSCSTIFFIFFSLLLLPKYVKLDNSFCCQVLVEVCMFLIIFIFIMLSIFVCIRYFCRNYRKKKFGQRNVRTFVFVCGLCACLWVCSFYVRHYSPIELALTSAITEMLSANPLSMEKLKRQWFRYKCFNIAYYWT